MHISQQVAKADCECPLYHHKRMMKETGKSLNEEREWNRKNKRQKRNLQQKL